MASFNDDELADLRNKFAIIGGLCQHIQKNLPNSETKIKTELAAVIKEVGQVEKFFSKAPINHD